MGHGAANCAEMVSAERELGLRYAVLPPTPRAARRRGVRRTTTHLAADQGCTLDNVLGGGCRVAMWAPRIAGLCIAAQTPAIRREPAKRLGAGAAACCPGALGGCCRHMRARGYVVDSGENGFGGSVAGSGDAARRSHDHRSSADPCARSRPARPRPWHAADASSGPCPPKRVAFGAPPTLIRNAFALNYRKKNMVFEKGNGL